MVAFEVTEQVVVRLEAIEVERLGQVVIRALVHAFEDLAPVGEGG
ncbi:MAG TPA: hypothetical protein VFH48_17660 [Chloroflexota bacterium]|nr:hypothetical protein [Chloroflexota bacterium]